MTDLTTDQKIAIISSIVAAKAILWNGLVQRSNVNITELKTPDDREQIKEFVKVLNDEEIWK